MCIRDSDDTEREHEDMRTRQEWLNRLLISYSPEIADAFLRCYMDGYSVKELATELNMSENALSQQFRRMRKKMKHDFAWILEMMLYMLMKP